MRIRLADRLMGWGLASVLLVFGLLPLSNWIPRGLADPAYQQRWTEWISGTLICVGVGCIAAILSRSTHVLSRPIGRVTAWRWPRWSPHADIAVALGAVVVYAGAAWSVLDARPLLIDEIVQVLQARTYASGHLSVPTDSARAFFSMLHMVDTGARTYGQFPPGWPAMLAVGSMLNAEWLIGPVCGGVAVFAFARLIRQVLGNDRPVWVAAGVVAFALSPFVVFQFASHMSHGPALMWLLLAILGLVRILDGASTKTGVAAGVAAGCMFAVRPLDGVAFAIPAAVWLSWAALKHRVAGRVCLGVATGWMLPVLCVLLVNWRTTGSPFVFGYDLLWGASHGLGFHQAPWGDPHTPQRALELLSLYVTRLNVYMFESPFPALLPAIAALGLTLFRAPVEYYLIIATAVHAGLYAAYWHDGFYLGPRFVLPWVPAIILLSVRFGEWLASRSVARSVRAGLGAATASAVLLTVAFGIPARQAQYRSGLSSMRVDYAAEAERAGVRRALVFVRESWGAQLVARLWALGVSRAAVATLYSKVDACVLEHAVRSAEQAGVRGAEAEARFRPLLADSSRVVSSSISPDSTERMLPGSTYDDVCSSFVLADRAGYALLPPFLLDRRTGNTYVRDLGKADTLLIDRHPDVPAYRVFRIGSDARAGFAWVRLDRDSVARQP